MDDIMADQELRNKIAERFKELPSVVQEVILSANIEEHMRSLAEQHQLHFDQWNILENEVMLALLGLESTEDLAENIEHEVGVPTEVAHKLAEDISQIVFEPIRADLEEALAVEHTEETPETPVERVVAAEHPLAQVVPAIAPILPGTPPPPPPEGKAVRAPISESYNAGQASQERRIVEGDPYRESAA
ncbi:hypothetical protein C4568_04725 [Candidatus Parcubacteria bacterium]|nr:MAG: hypothetical protein C4568_04725 [Candidatus Parcubacteria bacterium]